MRLILPANCSAIWPALWLTLLAAAAGPAVARADETVGFVEVDENAERRTRAADLLARRRYAEALDVYRAGYAAHHQPSLLYLIGCTAQIANRARLAEHYFRRYLEDAVDAPAERRADAARRLANLRVLIERGQAQWTPENVARARQRREAEEAAQAREDEGVARMVRRMEAAADLRSRPGDGLITAGVVAMILARGMAAVSGSTTFLLCSASYGNGCDNAPTAAAMLQIPVVGPWASAGLSQTPFLVGISVVDGLLDGIGVTMLIAGAVKSSSARAAERGSYLQLVPWTGRGGAGFSVAGSF